MLQSKRIDGPEGIVHMVADGMRCYGNNGYLRGVGIPLLVISPGHARIFAEAGWDEKRVKEELFKLPPIPLSQVSPERQVAHPIYETWERGQNRQVCKSASDLTIVVAGRVLIEAVARLTGVRAA